MDLLFSFLFFGTFPIVIIIFIIVGIFIFKRRQSVEKQFRASALATGATYWKGLAKERDFKSILLTQPTNTHIQNLLIYQNNREIGEAYFGGETERDPTVFFDYASLPFTKYPSLWLVVDSRKNNILGQSLMDTIGVAKRLQLIQLEGDFRNDFKVYMNPGQQIEALTALNPASMEKLMTYFDTYDIEICSERLYIYTMGALSFYKQEVRQKMMIDLENLAKIL